MTKCRKQLHLITEYPSIHASQECYGIVPKESYFLLVVITAALFQKLPILSVEFTLPVLFFPLFLTRKDFLCRLAQTWLSLFFQLLQDAPGPMLTMPQCQMFTSNRVEIQTLPQTKLSPNLGKSFDSSKNVSLFLLVK